MPGEHRIPPVVLAAIAETASAIPADVLVSLTTRLRQLPEAVAGRDPLLASVGQHSTRTRLGKLLGLWDAEYKDGTHAELAAAIESAAAMHDWHRRNQSLELVWTGPVPHGSILRRTDQALLELIRGTRKRLLIVTFAAYRMPALHQALVEAADREVAIDFILESKVESKGKVTIDPIIALGPELSRRSTIWTWPAEARPKGARGRRGALHVKCAIADGARLLVSSANLTEDALLLNMELGLLIEGGKLPPQVENHFAELRSAGILRSLDLSVSGMP